MSSIPPTQSIPPPLPMRPTPRTPPAPPPSAIHIEPNVQHVQAIVLSTSSPRYHYASIELNSYAGPLRTVRWLPRLGCIFGEHVTPSDTVCSKGIGGRRLRSPLHFFFEYPPNSMPRLANVQQSQSIHALAGQTPFPWKGNVVVLKFNGGLRRSYQDVDDSDLRAIAHFFCQKRAPSPSLGATQALSYYSWRG
ncbi:hypothetical protein RhiJN_01306 [Ceratobasidium sp. AG-Ba]|nr:hypothetical protein RhiJN_01306 [Ceratobasidium sp. AG-Ba]